MTPEQVRHEHIPASYDYRWHVACCVVTTLAAAAVCVWRLTDVQAWHWLVFGGTMFITNAGEYALHRGPFHVPFKGFARPLYFRHTTMHHAMYDHESMAWDSPRDLLWILLPPWGYAAVIAITSPIVALLGWLEPNAGWMFLLAQTVYYAVYELLHTASHLPASSPLAQSRIVRAVSRHHRVHHDPRLMAHYNFNFALPLFDWLFKTTYRERHATDLAAVPPHQTRR